MMRRGYASELLTDNCVIGKFAHGQVNPKCKPPTQEIAEGKVSDARTSEKENKLTLQQQHSNWTSVFDKITGKAIFVNLSTGMTTRMNPCQDTGMHYDCLHCVSAKAQGYGYHRPILTAVADVLPW